MATLVMTPTGDARARGQVERFGTLQRDFSVPWDHIDSARAISDTWRNVLGWRWPGLGIPHVVLIGRMVYREGRDFCAIYMDKGGVLLELHDEPYRRLLISAPGNVVESVVHRVTQG